MATIHTKTFPNETAEYREARNELLLAEIGLRRETERVAKMRRELPIGGKLKEDYVFDEMIDGTPQKVKFSELFASGKETLAVYSMMYGPDDPKACTSCNSIIDGLDGSSTHIADKINFVVVAKAPLEKLMAWAKYRGWRNVRLLSSFNNSYNLDYFGENEKGNQMPSLNIFQRTPNGIFHTYHTEIMFAPVEPGQDPRHVDAIWPVWNMFDMTPEGRGEKWYPKHEYTVEAA